MCSEVYQIEIVQSVILLISRCVGQSVCQSMCQSISATESQSVDQSIGQSASGNDSHIGLLINKYSRSA
jgi:hypothetical protein